LIVVADTSALFAAFDAGQPEHLAAAAVMEDELLLVSPLVLTELDHLIQRDFGFDAAMQVAQALSDRIADGRYRLASLTNTDLAAAAGVRHHYRSLELDLADAVGVVLADRHRTNLIFTLDQRDFRAIAPLTTGFDSFRILPADR
jgi:predicted nucleic acid-binding protein